MRSFSELGPRGQTARLRHLALHALTRYDFDVAAIRPLANHFNTIFRVDTADGNRAVLRINRPRHRTLADIRSELAWLDALRRETDLIVTEPIPARDGEFVTTIEAPGVPEPRHCALFRWIDGRGQIRRPTLQTVVALGATLARLHDHADRYTLPPGFTDRKLDRVWPFGRPPALDHDEPDDLFTPERRAVLHEAAARVESTLAELYTDPSGLRFLHADLHLGNVKLTRAGLAVLDFDDSLWCYPVQDAGISLFYLQYYPNEPDLRAAFTRGYTSIRPWPETATAQVDTFSAARQLELISAMANAEDPVLASYLPRTLERGVGRLAAWLESSPHSRPPSGGFPARPRERGAPS
jgi:Ser/Thr protein kinase RdoA (MazF antagonist)